MERTAFNRISYFGSASLFQRIFATVGTWQDRASGRQNLGEMEPHMLKDIGLDYIEARREAAKPFWQA